MEAAGGQPTPRLLAAAGLSMVAMAGMFALCCIATSQYARLALRAELMTAPRVPEVLAHRMNTFTPNSIYKTAKPRFFLCGSVALCGAFLLQVAYILL